MVYSFGNGTAEGRGDQRELLGGKGAGLAEMTLIGLPVPAGFTVTTEACAEYYQLGRSWPKGLEKEVREAVARLERASGRRLGDAADPLLVSVRSGAARSMPGMMETILNLGLNDASVEGLARSSRVPRFAWDSYRRFIQMYATVVSGLSKETLEQKLHDLKQRLGLRADTEIPAEQLAQLCAEFKRFYHAQTGREFPQDPWEQLRGAIEAVFGSWMAEKAETYRRVERIAGLRGTAVNVQQMVFGNFGDDSGTGVCFTRDPSTGANEFYGDLLVNAQGEDVVAGIRTPMPLKELATLMPDAWDQLCAVRVLLETHYRDMQDLEFTIERGRLFMLQCRSGKRSPMAAFRIAVEQATRPLIEKDDAARLVRRGHLPRAYATRAGRPILSKAEAVRRIQPEDIERLFYPVIDPRIDAAARLRRRIATGINAVPGAACGQIAFFAADAERMAQEGHKVILVRRETSPEDVGGMHASAGILTATGGKTSHAAVVARGWGKCCIVGCGELRIDPDGRRLEAGGRTFGEGDFLTLDGTEGHVYEGRMELVLPQLPPEYETLMRWADELRSLRVRANADTPYDAANAVRMGAEGIGLCRTEHMFFDTEERRLAMQRMILADTEDERRAALAELIPFQRADFIGIFEAMDGRPVTIRLVDPPLHEFVPHEEPKQRELARVIGVSFEKVRDRVGQLHETNPMLGHRGCRLCVSYPEILQMQVRAIVEAACNCAKRRVRVLPEIMIPLAIDARELGMLVAQARRVADAVLAEHDVRLPYLVGTMVETPRAALLAGALAAVSEFFSFGTNDLTQMTMGLSRDDAGRFLPYYLDREGAAIFESDPFQSIDVPGVGQLVEIACRDGRSANPKLKLGICGEHGGDPASIGFFARAGLDYVSCSPFRVPIARLVAAHLAAAKSPAAKSPAAKSTAAKSASPARASSGDGPLRSKGPAAARKRSKSRTDAEPRAGAKAKAKAGAKAGKGAALQKRSKTALRSAR
ncbi:MAG TPA: PEP/pyruvate-binding domain-containing protein [Phycisphaerales bacterium]|nr:PEP/pyruvate-binding domain-containing protein [Phycisphaerales bacterium]HMP36152.1 PEP/pyruvate-binding domain-containing protein [Phycisphaerales bacterium]